MSYAPLRPELHVTPEIGVLNAPAGVLTDGHVWHMFHQFQPQLDGPSRWAHQVSSGSPYAWDICDDVLAPSGSQSRLRAGSVVAVGDKVLLFYTAVEPNGDGENCFIDLAEISDLAETTVDVSDEASQVDQHVSFVSRLFEDQPEMAFRSPCVVEDPHGGWNMLAVSGPVDHPQLMIACSDNAYDWQLSGPLRFEGDTGTDADLVAPRIIRLKDEVVGDIWEVLVATIEHNGVDVSGYMVGKLDGTVFKVSKPFRRIDYGHDFTRPRNTNTIGSQLFESAVLFGSMNGVGRYDNPTTQLSMQSEGWANCLSLPRRTTLQDGTLYQTPMPGLAQAIEQSYRAHGWMGLIDLDATAEHTEVFRSPAASVTVDLVDAAGATAARISHTATEVMVDRSMNPKHEGDDPAVAPLDGSSSDSLTIIVDGSTVEVFADGGVATLASRVYFNGGFQSFAVKTFGSAAVERCYEVSPTQDT